MKIDLQRLEIGEWVIRFREPEKSGPHSVLWLFHGWQGDEDSMWVFASQIPDDYLILAPRGPFPTNSGGYSWYPLREQGWPSMALLKPTVFRLLDLMENWPLAAPWGDFGRIRVAGFSQGAALAYTFTLLFPDKVEAVAGLAGFLPIDVDVDIQEMNLSGTQVYISHGRFDQIVPVRYAEMASGFFERLGAQVSFCQSEVGHKLGANCFRGLEVFFEKQEPG